MSLEHLHPAVATWFQTRLGSPTTAQSRGWEAIRRAEHTLIAAPTGSGKTLAAFLIAIDQLLREATLPEGLADEIRVVYVSPLKALSTDIHKNLATPLEEIPDFLKVTETLSSPIRTAIRSGDTPTSERAAMLRRPPHILVTTPESLYLMLTAARSRELFRTVTTVIVDEIHAVINSRRGSHLALTLERLQHVAQHNVQRIGLSATQKPIEQVAEFLTGASSQATIVNEGHQRDLDLALELPGSPLEAVMSREIWDEVYERLVTLIEQHTTTIIFVNTRRLAERVSRHLSERLGADKTASHHGSLSKERRLDVEGRLRAGDLKALVATASLELGIDIGHVDLVCQIGSPKWISTVIQRVGRSGHTVRGTPKGRLFPLTRDDLIECTALLQCIRAGELDAPIVPHQPLDVLAQQVVAECACESWSLDRLFAFACKAYPYRHLERSTFDEVITMLAHGFATPRGRRAALLHHDAINHRVTGRRSARLTAITSGGAIPDNADYRVIQDPDGTFVGSVNEDFAIESMTGDIFQLGNTSWRVLQIGSGTLRVASAHGETPNIPFWLGEAPGRSDELSRAVANVRERIGVMIGRSSENTDEDVAHGLDIPPAAATQLIQYLRDTKRILGVLPTQDTLVLERFFDESGGMQLVLHSPFGSRINRAWGLALRKRFCRQFNFELQAAATENAILLSLGPQHSFPLEDVFRYLQPNQLEEILVQALLDAPLFQTRWRWCATLALAIPRHRGGRRVPPPLQRMQSDDLMAAVFPDAAACIENIAGDRSVPNHPLVRQTLKDCLHEAMDLTQLSTILTRVLDGSIQTVARDTPEPSPLCHEVLNAQPYAFLDDAPLEERRAQAVRTRRALDPAHATALGSLDAAAIARVADEAWPDIRDVEELHDTLLTSGFLTEVEGINARGGDSWKPWFDELVSTGRAVRATLQQPAGKTVFWVATERSVDFLTAYTFPNLMTGEDTLTLSPSGAAPPAGSTGNREDAITDLLRGRLDIVGPITTSTLAHSTRIPASDVTNSLARLEVEGTCIRGRFTPSVDQIEWCNRRLLARIHHYTLNRLRAEIEPVALSDLMRFLFRWQRLEPSYHVMGARGLEAIISMLDGYEIPAGAWETEILPARIQHYDPALLDTLCLTGQLSWARLTSRTTKELGARVGPVRSTRIALLRREHMDLWANYRAHAQDQSATDESELTANARAIHDHIERHGAMFFSDLVRATGLLKTQVEVSLGELVSRGLITSDSFAGLRALMKPAAKRSPIRSRGRRRLTGAGIGFDAAGRWSIITRSNRHLDKLGYEDLLADYADVLLQRYGVVFRRMLSRESTLPPWRDLVMTYRRLEARGEVRGGRFVAGVSGEQFALPDAVELLREIRRTKKAGALTVINATDPVNLTGTLLPGERIPSIATQRIVFRDGVPVAVYEGGRVRVLETCPADAVREVEEAAILAPTLRLRRALVAAV